MSLNDFFQYASINDPTLVANMKVFTARPDVQETKGLQRLNLVCENFRNLTFEQAYHMLDIDAFQDEFEETQSYKLWISVLYILRIFFGLAPLILTWYALSAAVSAYASTTQDTFLQMWQRASGLTFSTTAIVDVVLLLCLLLTNLGIVWLESQARKQTRLFAIDLHRVTDSVLKAVSIEGISQLTNDADINKIVKAIRIALDGTFRDIGVVMQHVESTIINVNNGMVQANKTIEQLFTNQVDPIFKQFSQDMRSFQKDIADLRNNITAISASSALIGTSSSEISNSAVKLAQDTHSLDTNVKQINTHLSTLNTTEASMITKIEATQLTVADEVKKGQLAMVGEVNKAQQLSTAETSKVVTSMNTTVGNVTIALDQMKLAAQSLAQTAQIVAGINPNTASKISANMLQLNKDTIDLSNQLRTTIAELQKVTVLTTSTQQTSGDTVLLSSIVDELQKLNTRKKVLGIF